MKNKLFVNGIYGKNIKKTDSGFNSREGEIK
jgi:hypothetical protein